MSKMAIEVHDVSYAYPDGTVGLDGVSMEVTEGERVAILGPNGAGKSTLLMVIDGVLQPESGYVRILGQVLNKKTLRKMRGRVGLVFQDADDELFCPTIEEDIAFGPLQLDLPQKEVEERVARVSRLLGLEGLLKKSPFRLSEGEKKRVALASVLSMDPDILLVDEPTTNLDYRSRRILIDLLNKLNRERGVTLVSATQEVDIVPEIADRVLLIEDKRVIADARVGEVLTDSRLLERTGLTVPMIARMFLEMRERGLVDSDHTPLTVEEAVKEISILRRRRGRAVSRTRRGNTGRGVP
ncbi:MAG: energy-coupling factor ABC transporter ATP-binding protein [Candidatus Bathyarchaeia archaeon]